MLAVAASTLFYYLYDPSKMSIPFVNMEPKRNIPVKRITGGGGSGSSRSGSSREAASETNESHNSNEAVELAPSRSSPSIDIFDTPPDKVTVACPHCAKSYRIAPELLGRSAVCKKCSKKFTMQDNGPNLASLKDL